MGRRYVIVKPNIEENRHTKQTVFRIEKSIKKRSYVCVLNGNYVIIYLMVRLIRQIYYNRNSCFSGNVKVDLDLSEYTSKSDVKKQQVLISHHLLKKTLI